jgi:hypothetical protein
MTSGLLYNAIDYAMFLGCYPIVCFEIVDCGPKDYGSVDSKKLLICTDQTEAKNTCVCLFNKSQILMYINKVTNGITTTYKAIHAFGKPSYDEYSSSDEEH